MIAFLYAWRFFNKSATNFFFNKTKTVWDINKILYSCKSTFDSIMNETQFLVHGHHGHAACRSPDAESNLWRFSSINRPIPLQFHVRDSDEVHQSSLTYWHRPETKNGVMNSLRIAVWHANGLAQRSLEVTKFMVDHKINIVVISETHFNFSIIKFTAQTRGGSAIIIEKSIQHELLHECQSDHI